MRVLRLWRDSKLEQVESPRLRKPQAGIAYIGDRLSFVGNAELVINNDGKLTAGADSGALYVPAEGIPASTE